MTRFEELPLEILCEIATQLDPPTLARFAKTSKECHAVVHEIEVPRRLRKDMKARGGTPRLLLRYALQKNYLLFESLLKEYIKETNPASLLWHPEITDDIVLLEIIKPLTVLSDRSLEILRCRKNAKYIVENFTFRNYENNPVVGVYIEEKLYEIKSV